MPTEPAPKDALTATAFSIEIDGVEIATFSMLNGITSEVEPVDLVQSTETGVAARKIPGRRIPPTVVLTRGQNSSTELWDWHDAVVQGNVEAARKSCTLVMFGADGKPVARYHLDQAWPSKLEIGAVKSGGTEVLTETVTIVCENIQRVAP